MKIPSIRLDRFLMFVIVMFVLIPGAVLANETTSAIKGTVVGEDGNAVADASVVVLDERTGMSRKYSTNDQGNFYAARLPVGGPYKITVDSARSVTIRSISLGDVYNITINKADMEELTVYGQATLFDVATGPSARFSSYDLANAVAFDRDIVEVYSIDPRINLDPGDRGSEINCAGKHPRFNSTTLDGVSQNDRFGLNSNPYSTATGMPFPYDSIQQVTVELAPFDVTYGGFSACNFNAVTKSGTNEWKANVFYEYTSDNFRGETIDNEPDLKSPGYTEDKWGISGGGPIIQDKLFIFAAYEKTDEPEFIGQGFSGSGIGTERPWLSQSDFDRINTIAQNIYGYDTGGAPSDGIQDNETYMFRLDWSINDYHSAALIYNYFDGFEDRASDGDADEFEFSNHFYRKGTESETLTLRVTSQWTDALSTEVFVSNNEIDDSQVTRGPGEFGDFQINLDRDVVYLGADDSRQANSLATESDFYRVVAEYLVGDHIITAGYEREELSTFNVFVQHSQGGEYDFFDDSVGDPTACAALTAQGRFDDATCGLSGIDKFELGRPSRIFYGSAGVTNNAFDAAAEFKNSSDSLFLQDKWFLPDQNLTLTFGFRYDRFETGDSPVFNQAVTDLLGVRNDEDIDGVSILMPRLGFSWEPRSDLSVRGGLGLYSGGNPTVWLSNVFSNDGITNVQLRLNNFNGALSVLDGTIPLQGNAGPGRAAPQALFDQVTGTTAANANNRRVVLLDPGYDQPGEWKFALGLTYQLPWYGIEMAVDYMHTKLEDGAIYQDLSQEVVGTTILGQPIYDFTKGSDNLILTNSKDEGESDSLSFVFTKDFDFGLELFLGYAYTQSEDVSPMTSSVASSNFDNLATLDINDPGIGDSNYVVPHRVTLRAVYSRQFFDGLTTRFSLYGSAGEGKPQSFVMSGGDLEGDGFFGRHLLYVPSGAGDPNVVFEAGFDQAAFFAFVDREDLGSGFVDRNETNAKWSALVNVRLDQELPTFLDGVKGKAFVKIYNLGNLLNDDWGKIHRAQFFSRQVVNASIDAQGRYVYERFRDRSVTDLQETRSLWEMRFGLEFSF